MSGLDGLHFLGPAGRTNAPGTRPSGTHSPAYKCRGVDNTAERCEKFCRVSFETTQLEQHVEETHTHLSRGLQIRFGLLLRAVHGLNFFHLFSYFGTFNAPPLSLTAFRTTILQTTP